MTSLLPILTRLGLEIYLDRFILEGFETWEALLDVTESDLEHLDVKLGHRRVLQREIHNVRGFNTRQLAPLVPFQSAGSSSTSHAATDDHRNEYDGDSGAKPKRKYRRHPKPDENAPERPASAYVLFSNKIRDDLRSQNFSFTEIAKRVGEQWQILTPKGKEPYESRAATAKERYHVELASYKGTEQYREYVQYLAEFKAKHADYLGDKRPRYEAEMSVNSNGSNDNESLPDSNVASYQQWSQASGSYPAIGGYPPTSTANMQTFGPETGLSQQPTHSRSSVSMSPITSPMRMGSMQDHQRQHGEPHSQRARISDSQPQTGIMLPDGNKYSSGKFLTHATAELMQKERSLPGPQTSTLPQSHNASDSSKSSDSNQSSGNTTASSLYNSQSLIVGRKVKLPPLSSIVRNAANSSLPSSLPRPGPRPTPFSSSGLSSSGSAYPGMRSTSLELPMDSTETPTQLVRSLPSPIGFPVDTNSMRDSAGRPNKQQMLRNLTIQTSSTDSDHEQVLSTPKMQTVVQNGTNTRPLTAEAGPEPLAILAEVADTDRTSRPISRRGHGTP